ncbi:alkaline phosphatase [Chroococcidiopsis cubana SAG 39.79]|jgi:membrane protein DedA with SNARE-associated domain|uniref:Alkaline phosphatase n=2 Tax=Chroococcidiopsidaceae TaxID=1890528 RepID=A0AB37UQQ0_9CYAN|nr:DedA family protein [Chroococcidiopsis cubana]RUT13718.1 alkaline phosphatase [Chroococcidiopsis cubana SAG 39.79]
MPTLLHIQRSCRGSSMTEWIVNIMTSLGYLGIGLLMFLENLFPPIPSELIMPLAGFTAAQGKLNIVGAIAAGVIGTVIGALPWYYAGKFLGEERLKLWADKYGKWITITGKDIDRSKHWFDKHGVKAVLLCRMVPGVRTLISLPAGIGDMHVVPFLIYSTVGTILWVGLLTAAGYILGDHYQIVEEYLAPVSKIVLAALVIGLIIVIIRRRQRR